jgi:hypothetical protein
VPTRPLEGASLSNDVAVSEPGEGNGQKAETGAERRPIQPDAGTEHQPHQPEAGTERQPNQPDPSPDAAGVLANLPRTRPQRATARRTAARTANAAAGQPSANGNGSAPRTAARKPAAKRTAPAKPSQAKAPRAKPARKRQAEDAVPRQGYESVEERATGPVQPPGGTELVGTAAEIVSEIAKAGISGGERVLRDVLSRLGR